jgi:multimeric flavodoxin WrbA
MKSVYPKLREAELLVLGMPLYVPMPGEMQNFINRMIPLYEPFLQTEGGRTTVRLRAGVRMSKLALVATGGWWEVENFDPLVEIVREIALKTGVEFVGAVLRPHAFIMSHFPEEEASILGSVRKAGVEMVRDHRMSPETLNEIRRPLIDQEQLRQLYNDEMAKVLRSDH